jgi:chemotaxis response regulator CheB
VKAGTSGVPAASLGGASCELAATPTRTSIVLASSDPVFAALSKRALEQGTSSLFVVALAPSELLEALRQLAHDVVILDADGQDLSAIKTLATKVMLVSDAPIVLVSAYLAAGSPGLGALLQSIAATFVQKPQGPSSLSLADEDGPSFVAALQAAFAEYEYDEHEHEDENEATDDVDEGWDVEAGLTAEQAGVADD